MVEGCLPACLQKQPSSKLNSKSFKLCFRNSKLSSRCAKRSREHCVLRLKMSVFSPQNGSRSEVPISTSTLIIHGTSDNRYEPSEVRLTIPFRLNGRCFRSCHSWSCFFAEEPRNNVMNFVRKNPLNTVLIALLRIRQYIYIYLV